MTLIIEIPVEIETKLELAAQNIGISKNELARIILEEKLTNSERKRLPDKSRIIATDLPVRDRSREREWLEKNCDEYDGLYVALDGDKLIAQGAGFKEVSLSR